MRLRRLRRNGDGMRLRRLRRGGEGDKNMRLRRLRRSEIAMDVPRHDFFVVKRPNYETTLRSVRIHRIHLYVRVLIILHLSDLRISISIMIYDFRHLMKSCQIPSAQ